MTVETDRICACIDGKSECSRATPPAAQGEAVAWVPVDVRGARWFSAADDDRGCADANKRRLALQYPSAAPFTLVPLYAAPVRATEAMVDAGVRGVMAEQIGKRYSEWPDIVRAALTAALVAASFPAPVRATEAALAGAFRQGAEWAGLAYLKTGPDGFYEAIEDQVRRRYLAASKGAGE